MFLVGVSTATRPSNKFRLGIIGPGLFAAGDGMAAEEAAAAGQVAVQGGDNLLLGAAGVGDERSLRGNAARPLGMLGNLAHGRADDHQIRLDHSFGYDRWWCG